MGMEETENITSIQVFMVQWPGRNHFSLNATWRVPGSFQLQYVWGKPSPTAIQSSTVMAASFSGDFIYAAEAGGLVSKDVYRNYGAILNKNPLQSSGS